GVRGREHRVDAVTAALDDDASARPDRIAQDLVMSSQRGTHRLRLLFPMPRRHDEIREQKRHSARRQLSHTQYPSRTLRSAVNQPNRRSVTHAQNATPTEPNDQRQNRRSVSPLNALNRERDRAISADLHSPAASGSGSLTPLTSEVIRDARS